MPPAFGLGLAFSKEVILAKITRAIFPREVAPPCDLSVEARIDEQREDAALIAGTVKLAGQIVAEAEILLVAVQALNGAETHRKNIVFNDHFMAHYDVVNIAKASEKKS